MKTQNRLIILSIILVFFSGCDKLDPPFTESCANCCGDADNQEPIKRILVEEFTGHKCSNCPNASRIIDDLVDLYCDHLVIVACHPTGQAFTEPNESGPFSTDFRKEECAEIGEEFGFLGMPSALINRKNIEGDYFLWTSDWIPSIDMLLFDSNGEKILPDLDVNIDYQITNFENKQIDISISIDFLNQLNGNYNVVVLITENNIISGQKDVDENTGEEISIENYEHNHIYRSAVNGTWGEAIESNTNFTYPNFIFNTSKNINWDDQWYNMENCAIVAYVYNAETMEIIQASEEKIILDD